MRKLIINIAAVTGFASAINATGFADPLIKKLNNEAKIQAQEIVEENGMTTLKNDNALEKVGAFSHNHNIIYSHEINN